MEKDPNGLVAAVSIVILAIANIFNWQVSDDTATTVGTTFASILPVVGILLARRKTWAPDTVRALTPETVGAAGELPSIPDPTE